MAACRGARIARGVLAWHHSPWASRPGQWAPAARAVQRCYSQRLEPAQMPTLLDVGSRSLFDEDHDMLRSNVRRFFTEHVVPHHDQWDKEGQVSREVWRQAGENCILGVTVPEEYGGPGGSVLDASVVWDEQGFTGCFGPGFSIHSDIVLPYFVHYGTEEQKHKYLPRLCSGEHIAAIAMTEPGAGSDLQGVTTTAVRDGDEWVLNGSKVFISNGQMADVVVVVAKTDLQAKRAAHGLSLFIVEGGTPGFERGQNLDKIGLKAQDTSELFFNDVRLPATSLLGEENKGFYQLMQELPQERLLLGGLAVAHAEAVYEWTRAYVKERKAFGGTLSDLQTVRHTLATVKTETAVARAFYDKCLQLHQAKKLDAQMASMVKYHCTDVECKVADACLQLFGGWGYMTSYPVARAFIDARVQRIYGGANEVMKELISRSI